MEKKGSKVDEEHELQMILSELPNSQYLKILLAQIMRHYDPKIKYIFQKRTGWQLAIEQYNGSLCRIKIHNISGFLYSISHANGAGDVK